MTIAVIILGFTIPFLLGVPVSLAIALASAAALYTGGYHLSDLPRYVMSGVDSFLLLSIPFFILAGNLFNVSGASSRLFKFLEVVAGRLPGGLGQVTIGANVVFSGMSGAALSDIAGLGVMVSRAMREAGYRARFAAATILSGSVLGPLIPPSIMMILYSSVTGASVGRLFLAGAAAGLFVAVVLMAWIALRVKLGLEFAPPPVKHTPREAGRLFITSLPALMAPIVILGSLRTGTVTATEAGALAVVYALLIAAIYRGGSLAKFRWALSDSVITTANIMWLIAVSTVMGHILTVEGAAASLSALMASATDDPLLALLIINVGLLLIGCVLETTPALLIASAVLGPVIARFGIDPIHFGVVIVFNLIIGIITPPMGIGLFAVSAVTKLSVEEVMRGVLPYLVPLLLALLALTVFPQLSLWLPNLLMGR
jgi:tripartite ATP-independent transporter DctM subunit